MRNRGWTDTIALAAVMQAIVVKLHKLRFRKRHLSQCTRGV